MRADLAIIAEWIKPESSVLDLGCGDGTLLNYLREHQQAHGIGLEIDEKNIEICLDNNLNIIQSNLNNVEHRIIKGDGYQDVLLGLNFINAGKFRVVGRAEPMESTQWDTLREMFKDYELPLEEEFLFDPITSAAIEFAKVIKNNK